MKIILTVFGLMFAISASASECPSQIDCGVYEGSGAWYDVNGVPLKDPNYNERLEFQAIDAQHVQVKAYIYKGDQLGEPWADALMTIEPDGQVRIVAGGKTVAAGFCRLKACNISFRPVEVSDGGRDFVNVFANIFRFDGKTLKRYNMVANTSDDADLIFQRSTLTKK